MTIVRGRRVAGGVTLVRERGRVAGCVTIVRVEEGGWGGWGGWVCDPSEEGG